MVELRAPVGTRDVLPPESARWERLLAEFATRVERSGYGLVLSPLFEDVAVFERVGQGTDVVRKEMYDFDDKGGRRIALRPEGTAGLVRAFVQHRPPVPFKAWYVGPRLAATASTTSSESRPWAPTTPTSTSRLSPWPGPPVPGSA